MKIGVSAILLFCSIAIFAQNQKSLKDTLVWTDGTKYAGTVIKENKHTGELQFMTEDSQMHNVSASVIARLVWAHPQQSESKPTETAKPGQTDGEGIPKSEYRRSQSSDEPIDWFDPRIPHRTLVKHRTGIALTAVGTTLMVGGIVLIAVGWADNGQTTTTTNQYSGTQTNVNIGPEGGVGILSFIVGIPMMISGIVKMHRSSRSARLSILRSVR